MKKPHLILLLLTLIMIGPLWASSPDTLLVGARTHFIQNKGQWDARVLFQSQLHNAAIFAESNAFVVALGGEEDHDEPHHHHPSAQMHAYRVSFVGANPITPEGEAIDADGGYDNYYITRNPSRWASHLPHYRTLRYRNLYPGTDLKIQAAQNALKYSFYLEPNADPSSIELHYEGVDGLKIIDSNLIISTTVGNVIDTKPFAYQETPHGRVVIPSKFKLNGNNVSFELGEYDHTLPLVIDPVLIFSTYTGSIADNWGSTATYDLHKNTYTAGLVFSIGYPTTVGAYDRTYNNNVDIGIMKLDETGSNRIYATYLGGCRADMPHSLFVNSFDELIVFGTTGSEDFPVTPTAFDTTFNRGSSVQYEGSSTIDFPNGSDIFVCRFSADGTQLQASTYVGGTSNDGLNYRQSYHRNYQVLMSGNDSLYFNYGDGSRGEIITDDLNNVYVGSTTMSTDFPTTPGCIQSGLRSWQDGVVFKLDYNLSHMLWSTCLGGNQDDAIYSIDVDSAYNVIVCGGTISTNFPVTTDAYQTTYGGGTADGFITKISYSGDQIISSTYFGSSSYDQLYFVRCGQNDEVCVYGQTKAPDSTWIYNAAYSVPNSGMLLARLTPDLKSRIWSTVFGTSNRRPNLSPTAFGADICNRVYATGWGRDFVGYNSVNWNQRGTTGMETTPNAYQDTTDGQDFYIMALSADASTLDYATFFGELHGKDHVDGGTSRFDRLATLYQSVCASCGSTSGFPITPGAWSDSNYSNNCNNAIFKFNVNNDFAVADFIQPPVGCAPYTVDFQNTGRGTQFQWNFGDGTTSTDENPTHIFSSPGLYTVQLIASIPDGCRSSDTTEYQVQVLGNQGQRITLPINCDGTAVQMNVHPRLGCTYEWIQGNVSDSSIANPWVTESGIYILHIYTNTCDETDTFDVQFLSLNDTLIIHSPTCPGDNDGYALIEVHLNTTSDVTYYWDGVASTNPYYGDLAADGRTHTLVVESNGCQSHHSFTIPGPPILKIEKESDIYLCSDSCTGWIHYLTKLPNLIVDDTLIGNLCEGNYTFLLTDTAGCPYPDTVTIIRSHSLDNISAWSDETELFINESTRLHVTHIDGASYHWSNGYTLNNPNSPDPVCTPVDTAALYIVTVTDSVGCTRTDSVRLHCTEVICGRPNIFIPNAFTPNGDGINDQLCFRGNFVLEFHFALFNRWGEKVFETHSFDDCWDGRYNNNWCPPGVYTYSCQITCEAGLTSLLKGDITLIR